MVLQMLRYLCKSVTFLTASFCKLITSLAANFSWKRENSPNETANAKNNHGNAAGTTGDHSPIQTAGRDININTYNQQPVSQENAIKDEDNWRDLIEYFTEHQAEKLLNPKLLTESQRESSYIIQQIRKKFTTLNLSTADTRSSNFVEQRDRAFNAIRSLTSSREPIPFRETWIDIGAELLRIKQKGLCQH